MIELQKKLRQRQLPLHVIALLLMLLPAVGSYFAARSGVDAWIWPLLAIVILGNLLAVVVP
jgi:hypothetical protein